MAVWLWFPKICETVLQGTGSDYQNVFWNATGRREIVEMDKVSRRKEV